LASKGLRLSRAQTLTLIVAAFIAVSVAVFSAIAASSKPADDQITPSPLLYRTAPVLAGPKLGGGAFSLSKDRGSFVLVNFFASWCAECATEEPQIRDLADGVDGIKVLGVDYDDNNAAAEHFLAHFHSHFPVIIDSEGQDALKWGVSAPPESFLIAPNEEVIAKIVGPTTASIVRNLVAIARTKGY